MLLEKYGYKKPEELLKQDKIYNRMSVQLPDLYKLERLLRSANGLIAEASTIKAVGEFLANIDLPLEGQHWKGNRKKYRDKALNMIDSCKGNSNNILEANK